MRTSNSWTSKFVLCVCVWPLVCHRCLTVLLRCLHTSLMPNSTYRYLVSRMCPLHLIIVFLYLQYSFFSQYIYVQLNTVQIFEVHDHLGHHLELVSVICLGHNEQQCVLIKKKKRTFIINIMFIPSMQMVFQ